MYCTGGFIVRLGDRGEGYGLALSMLLRPRETRIGGECRSSLWPCNRTELTTQGSLVGEGRT